MPKEITLARHYTGEDFLSNIRKAHSSSLISDNPSSENVQLLFSQLGELIDSVEDVTATELRKYLGQITETIEKIKSEGLYVYGTLTHVTLSYDMPVLAVAVVGADSPSISATVNV